MYFIDKESENFFDKKMIQAKYIDVYNKSIIYLLSNNTETRNHFKEIYDIKKNEVNINVFEYPWHTSTSINICRLAFNLFGDLSADNIEEGVNFKYTVSSIFKNIDLKLGIQALEIRFS